MAIVFAGNKTKDSPEAFAGVKLKSFIHPVEQFHDGYSAKEYELPRVNFSFGLFTIEVGAEWPLTKFSLAEVSYCLEGEGIFICDGEDHKFRKGDVIYIPWGETRIIKNTGGVPLQYLCIVDPAWLPEYEEVL